MEDRRPKLNRELLEQVRDFILEHPDYLNMVTFACRWPGNECGTVGCIAGWTCMLSEANQSDLESDKYSKVRNSYHLRELSFKLNAIERLGLTHEEAKIMFYKTNSPHGQQGACEVACKIDTILRDRDEFVAKFSSYGDL